MCKYCWSPFSCLQDFVVYAGFSWVAIASPWLVLSYSYGCAAGLGLKNWRIGTSFWVGRVSYVALIRKFSWAWSGLYMQPSNTNTQLTLWFPHGAVPLYFKLKSRGFSACGFCAVPQLSLVLRFSGPRSQRLFLGFAGDTLTVWCHSNKCSHDHWFSLMSWLSSTSLFSFSPWYLYSYFFAGRLKACLLGWLVTLKCP